MKKSVSHLPKPPDTLPGEARDVWKRLVGEYDISDAAGIEILTRACEAFGRMRQAQRIIDAEGLTVRDRWGQVKAHPALLIERDSRAGFLNALKQLRLDLEPIRDVPGRPPSMGR